MKKRSWLAVFAACALVPCLLGQGRTSVISGEVRDQTGGAIAGAAIEIRNADTSAILRTAADESGRFRASFLELARYDVTASYRGFVPKTAGPIELELDRESVVNLVLGLAGSQTAVVVEEHIQSLDATASALSALVGEQQIGELPLNGRDYLRLATLQPGVHVARAQSQNSNTGMGVQLSLDGSRPVQNSFRLDGISVATQNGSTPGSVNGLSLGVDAIREFSILTSTYGAEYGRGAGGIINAVTRSGTNEFHGSLFYFLRNDAFDARNYFDPGEPPEFRRQQFGASVGGPVLHNRLFFFANYEGLRQARGNTTINTTISDSARAGYLKKGTVKVDPAIATLLELYPHPNGQVLGDTGLFIFPNQTAASEDYITSRVDYTATAKDQLFFRYTFDSAELTDQTTFAIADRSNTTQTQSAVAEARHMFTPLLLNSVRAGFSRAVTVANLAEAANPAADNPALVFVPGARSAGLIDVPGLTQFPGGSEGLDAEFDAFTSMQVYDDFAWTAGRHIVTAGGSFERTEFNQDSRSTQNGQFWFNGLADFLSNRPLQLRAQLPGSNTVRGYRQSIAAGYVQDAWRISRNIRLDLGLRYEWTSVPTEANGRLANLDELTSPTMRTTGPAYRNPSTRNFAPRAGLSWDLFGTGRTILRGGYGIYDDLLLSQYLLIAGVRNPPFYLRGDVKNLQPGDFPSQAFAKLVTSATPDLRAERIPFDLHQPYVQQWNVNLQQALGRDSHLTLAYVGSHGVHLTAIIEDANLAVPVVLPDGRLYFPAGSQRLNPAFGMIRNRTFDGQSFYQAAQAGFQQNLRRGFQFQAAYTFGKSIDDDSATFAHNESDNSIGIPVNNPRFNRGLSNYDVRHVLVLNGQWEAPRFGGVAGALASDWRVGGIFTYGSGLPFSATLSYDAARTLTGRTDRLGGQRPDLAAGASNNPVTGDPNRWFDPSAFARPVPGFLGNLGRNTMTGPGLVQMDAFLARQFNVPHAGERARLEFRIEAYNCSNHTNFNLPDPSRMQVFSRTSTPEDVGRITSAGASREIQMGVKLLF